MWASKVIGTLIEISLELWDTRNKVLHGNTLEEQNRVKRVGAIQLVAKKYREGIKTVCTLCDKPTLQLLEWIETYTICRGSLTRKNKKKRRSLIRDILDQPLPGTQRPTL